ncbi:hypothetical protein [Martelella mangrovi]|uniref:Uncharacterized protein n=1 Tax=Martelella mangrovi TaxID=1397477 RepID=A0ABV2IE51_9HYPH
MARTQARSNRKRNAERKFPVSVRILVPEGGYGRKTTEMHLWLKERYGLEGFAWTSDSIPGIRDASRFFFPNIAGAAAFMERFPDLEYAAAPEVKLWG